MTSKREKPIAQLPLPVRPYFALERAIRRYAPEEYAEHKRLEAAKDVEGFNAWAARYGLPWFKFKETPWHTDIFPHEAKPYTKIPMPTRGLSETLSRYEKRLDEFWAEQKDALLEAERLRYEEEKPLRVALTQTRHACWLVLYQFKGMSHSEIAKWEFETNERHFDSDAVSKGIRRFALVAGVELRPPSTGGRPRKP